MAQTSQQGAERHDLLDRIWGWSQLGGAILAAVALVIALISAIDSKRSADAADRSAQAADQTARSAEALVSLGREQLRFAREELKLVAEQINRRPILRLQVDMIDPHPSERLYDTPEADAATAAAADPAFSAFKLLTAGAIELLKPGRKSVGLQLGFTNDGNADAMDTVVNLIVPPRSLVWKWQSAAGGETEMVTHHTGQEFEEFSHAIYAVDRVDVRRNIASVTFYRVEFPAVGKFPIRVSATHPDSTVSVSRTVEAL